MARYRKIDPRIWNDEKFRALSDAGKLAFLFLLTHPHMTSLGAMRATIGGLAEEIGRDAEGYRKAFEEVFAKGMAEHDSEARMIALPNFIRYNPPESPNVIKAWVGALDLLPECGLKNRAIARAKAYAEDLGEAFAKALPEVFAKAMPYQEQEQEQKKKEQMPPAVPTAAKKSPRAVRLADDWKLPKAWGEWALGEKPGWSAEDVRQCSLRFQDYWHAKAGKDAAKLDWQATWRNWVRNERGLNGSSGNSGEQAWTPPSIR